MVIRPITRRRMVAGLAAVAAIGGAVLATAGSAGATTSTDITITKVAPSLIASGLRNQVITVTGTGFDESDITGVTMSKCVDSSSVAVPQTYIVVSPTTLVVKTADTSCVAGASTITVTDGAGNTAVSSGTAAQALTFVDPPTLRDLTDSSSNPQNAVMTDATASLPADHQVTTAPISGGTTIRVYAGATPFQNSSSQKLAATLGGKALTSIAFPTALGGGGYAYFTAKIPAGTAGSTPGMTVTSGGVTVSFANSALNGFAYSGTNIAVSPAFGPSNGGTTITVTGTGTTWSTSSAPAVTVGDQNCGTITVVSTTKLTCVVPAIDDPNTTGVNGGPVQVTVGSGNTKSVLSATAIYTYLNNN